MKKPSDDARATMSRVHALAVAAMNAATADVSPGPDIPEDKWLRCPLPLRVAMLRTFKAVETHDAAVAAAVRPGAASAPRGIARVGSRKVPF